MTRTLHLLVLLALIVGSRSALPPTVPEVPAPHPLVEWAMGRFEAAGLDAPDLEVVFHDTKEPCNGNTGLYVPGEVDTVHICATSGSDTALRRTLLHELGHAWAAEHLDETERADFLALRGLEHWAAPAPWYLRGSEHAAETLAWGLQEGDLGVHTVEPNDPAALCEAFEALTGCEPISAAAAAGA